MTTKVQGDMYDIDGATVATVAAADKINFFDVTDSLVKEDTVQGVLDLVSAGFTASSLTALTASSTSTITGVPAGTKVIFVSFEGIDLSSGSGVSGVRIGDSGGIETTGYLSSGTYLDSATATSDNTTLFMIDNSIGTAGDNRGSGVLTLMDSSTNLWAWSCTAKGRSANVVVAGGDKALSGALTQVQLLTTGGTFVTTGSWNILYI